MVIFRLYLSGSALEKGDEAVAEALAFALPFAFAFAFTFALRFDSGAFVQPNDPSANAAAASAAKIL
jgi:hypothetical protein